jgi:demethoxyubiquinone hydroxylase (CLK1/Coq7/Cat5 family)
MANQTIHVSDTQRSIAALDALLHGERSAVETYEHAIARFTGEAPVELTDCLRSHLMRVDRLVMRIRELGGEAAMTSGMWGTFARLVGNGAALFGRKSAVAALEEGEDLGLRMYEDHLDDLDPESRNLVVGELQFEQRSTHAMMGVLRSRLLNHPKPPTRSQP